MINTGYYLTIGFFLSLACVVILYVLWGAWRLALRLTGERKGEDISSNELFAACVLIGVAVIMFWIALGWLMTQIGAGVSYRPG